MPRHEPRSSAPRHPEPELDLTCVDGGTSGKAVGGGRLDHGRAPRTAGAGLGNGGGSRPPLVFTSRPPKRSIWARSMRALSTLRTSWGRSKRLRRSSTNRAHESKRRWHNVRPPCPSSRRVQQMPGLLDIGMHLLDQRFSAGVLDLSAQPGIEVDSDFDVVKLKIITI